MFFSESLELEQFNFNEINKYYKGDSSKLQPMAKEEQFDLFFQESAQDAKSFKKNQDGSMVKDESFGRFSAKK
jgi:hypothetical protein